MDVPSFAFLGFAAIVAVLVNISTAPVWRRSVLLAANIAFILLLTHDPMQLLPFAGFLAVGYTCLMLMERFRKPALYVAAVAGVLFLFCWLKHYSFVPGGLFLPFAYLTVGLSYVFFRVMHLIIDAHDGALPHRIGIFSYLSYTLNFTSLFSGPIQLYQDYIRTEVQAPAPLTPAIAANAVMRIVQGFFKVSVLGAALYGAIARCTSAIVPDASLGEHVVLGSLVLALYPIYIYFNFSGYMDFVIGAARFMRIELPENFNAPLLALGFMDFWTRWHMTLSNWLKRYVYNPLLMELLRRFPASGAANALNVFAYFFTFFLIGLWHGQTPLFVMYGIVLGVGVSANKLYQIVMTKRLGRAGYRALCEQPLYRSASRGLNFCWFAFSLVWFWGGTWQNVSGLASALGPVSTLLALAAVWIASAVLLSALVAVWAWVNEVRADAVPISRSVYVRTAWCTVMAVLVVSVTVVLNAPAPVIVYKAF